MNHVLGSTSTHGILIFVARHNAHPQNKIFLMPALVLVEFAVAIIQTSDSELNLKIQVSLRLIVDGLHLKTLGGGDNYTVKTKR